jgi:hypothetical protein
VFDLVAFLGERTFCLEAARVALVEVALVAAAGAGAGLAAGARALFLLTSEAAFSLSSEAISSLPRFLPRTCFATGFATVCLVVVGLLGAVLARAVLVLDVVVVAAGFLIVAAALVTGAALTCAGFGAGAGGTRRSTSGVPRLVAGTRLTRRSRRSRMLAHWASHIARSLS